MKPLIFLDTETTGFRKGGKSVAEGHRIIELAFLKMMPSGELIPFQRYFNPEQEIDPGAFAVHGLSLEFLSNHPRFSECIDDILRELDGAHLIAHNASFDIDFLDSELARIGLMPTLHYASECTDTLAIARKKFPGQRNSLDALCERFGISIAHRSFHGALKDCYLLAQVYKALRREQKTMNFEESGHSERTLISSHHDSEKSLIVKCQPTDEEQATHEKFLQKYCS